MSISFPLVLRQLPPLFVVGLLQFLPILLPFFPLLCALLHCLLRLGHIEGVNRKTSKKKEIEWVRRLFACLQPLTWQCSVACFQSSDLHSIGIFLKQIDHITQRPPVLFAFLNKLNVQAASIPFPPTKGRNYATWKNKHQGPRVIMLNTWCCVGLGRWKYLFCDVFL